MKFETVLYAVSFFLLALISLPEDKTAASKSDAEDAPPATTLAIAAADEEKPAKPEPETARKTGDKDEPEPR